VQVQAVTFNDDPRFEYLMRLDPAHNHSQRCPVWTNTKLKKTVQVADCNCWRAGVCEGLLKELDARDPLRALVREGSRS
jgi:hypothetical protein